MFAPAVHTLGGLFVTSLVGGTRIVMEACMLGCGMWASAPTAVFFPSALHCPVPPVFAPEALQQLGNIDTDTAGHATDGQVVVYGCISSVLSFETYH